MAQPTSPERRRSRPLTPQALAPELRRLITPAARQIGFNLPELLIAWPDIVGADLAALAYPFKLSRPQGSGMTLTLRAKGAGALEVHHRIPEILDKLATFLGRPAIGAIKLIQGEVPTRAAARPARLRPLDPAKAKALDEALRGIEDPGLKSALRRLGVAVARRVQDV